LRNLHSGVVFSGAAAL